MCWGNCASSTDCARPCASLRACAAMATWTPQRANAPWCVWHVSASASTVFLPTGYAPWPPIPCANCAIRLPSSSRRKPRWGMASKWSPAARRRASSTLAWHTACRRPMRAVWSSTSAAAPPSSSSAKASSHWNARASRWAVSPPPAVFSPTANFPANAGRPGNWNWPSNSSSSPPPTTHSAGRKRSAPPAPPKPSRKYSQVLTCPPARSRPMALPLPASGCWTSSISMTSAWRASPAIAGRSLPAAFW